MIANTILEKRLKKALVEEMNMYNGGKSGAVKISLETFFAKYENKSIAYIFSEQGLKEITEGLKNEKHAADFIEFFLRFKTALYDHKEIYDIIFSLIQEDVILDSLIKEEFTKLKISKPEELKKYYVLIIIYINSNVMYDAKLK